MVHTNQAGMEDKRLDSPKELLVTSRNKKFAFYAAPGKGAVLLTGDFSGPQREQDTDVRRYVRKNVKPSVGTTWRN